MKFAMWLLLFSLAGLVVIFGWVVFARPFLITPVTDKNEMADTFMKRMYPNGKDTILKDCYYIQAFVNGVQGKLRTLKSKNAIMPKGLYAEDIISYSERPYGVVFITDLGTIIVRDFVSYKTECGF